MPLTNIGIKNVKPGSKPLKLFDGGGLFLLVTPHGGKWSRFKYRFAGKERLLSLGTYPEVPLAGHRDKTTETWIDTARDKREHARKLIANGIDPSMVRKSERDKKAVAGKNTFEIFALEWHAQRARGWTPGTGADKLSRLNAYVFPAIGKAPISALRRADLLKVLQDIESRGAYEVARRVRQMLDQIFRYALSTERVDSNPASDLRGALPPAKPVHHPAITEPKAVGALMRD